MYIQSQYILKLEININYIILVTYYKPRKKC